MGGVDPFFVSRSLREREPGLNNHPCMPLFKDYFDRFEAISQMESPTGVLLPGPRGMAARETFWPTFTVYADGQVKLGRDSGFDIDEEQKALWIDVTADALGGLDLIARRTRQS